MTYFSVKFLQLTCSCLICIVEFAYVIQHCNVFHALCCLICTVDALDYEMPPKGTKWQKLNEGKSTSVVASSNRSITSMFARQQSHNQLRNAQPSNQHPTSQAGHMSEVTDRPRLENRLSLSSRKKRHHSDAVDSNDAVDVFEPSCAVFRLTGDKIPDNKQTDSPSADLLPMPFTESFREDGVGLVSTSNQQSASDCATHSDERSEISPERQGLSETEALHVPYYLENFLLVLIRSSVIVSMQNCLMMTTSQQCIRSRA